MVFGLVGLSSIPVLVGIPSSSMGTSGQFSREFHTFGPSSCDESLVDRRTFK